MYEIQLSGVVYSHDELGRPFTLVSAMRAIYGVHAAWIIRPDGSVAVMHAGDASSVMWTSGIRRWRARDVTRGARRRVVGSGRHVVDMRTGAHRWCVMRPVGSAGN